MGEFTYKAADQALGPSFGNWFLTKASVCVLGGGTHIQLILPSSKTDPFRKGIKLIIAATNDLGCPVYAMQELLTIDSHRNQDSPSFGMGQWKQLTFAREHVVKRLRELAIISGLGSGY